MAKILIVEDEADLASLLAYNLHQEGHETLIAPLGAAALNRLPTYQPDLVLLDLNLPDISGKDVAQAIRENPQLKDTHIIMITARGEDADRIRGFELGADDYVVKPFVVKEVMLRVKAVLRRGRGTLQTADGIIKAGDIALDTARHEVNVSGAKVELTALEFRLLKTLLERPGRVQTREALLSDVWGIEADITTRTVDTHIKRLREKLGSAADIIETVRGVGYRLVE